MGLMDFLKLNKDTKDSIKKADSDSNMITINRDNGIITTAFNIRKVASFKHRDGVVSDLVEAKLITGGKEDAIIFSNASPVCFEVPHNNKELIKDIIKNITNVVLPVNQTTYVGRAYSKEDTRIFSKPSSAVSAYVEKINYDIQEEIRKSNERYEKEMELQELARKQHEDKMKPIYEKRIQAEKEEIANRIAHPFLNDVESAAGKAYDGVNLNNGEILRIRDIKKIAKDMAGTYIYTARLTSTPHETDVEFLGKDVGLPVIFTLPYRLNDIIYNDYNPEIKEKLERAILQNLSDGFSNNVDNNRIQKLHNIGGINKEGKQISNSPNEVSNAIISRIQEEEQRYIRDNLPPKVRREEK